MREHKYRAWDQENKKMITDFFLCPTSPTWGAFQSLDMNWLEELQKDLRKLSDDRALNLQNIVDQYIFHFRSSDYGIMDWADFRGLNNFIVMEWTEAKDCYNKDVYEGDIILLDDIWPFRYGVVVYKSFGYYIEAIGAKESHELRMFYDKDSVEFCVVGNIYENSELIN